MIAKAQGSRRHPLYRIGQFLQALTARPLTGSEWKEISPILSSAQQALFRRMPTNDQRHSFQVMRFLVRAQEENHDLLAAALLHDVGKSRYPLRLWERPIVVLARLYRPIIASRWGGQVSGVNKGWKRPFVIYEQHPEWGAEMAASAGCSPLTVWLIRYHQEPAERLKSGNKAEIALLWALQRADNAN